VAGVPARTIVKGGSVVDVRSSSLRDVDIVVVGGRITAIDAGVATDEHDLVLDASGLTVCPGFIDVHVHAEHVIWSQGCLEPALAQGVTSLVLGQDGCSWAPGNSKTVAFMQDYFAAINGRLPGTPGDGLSVAEMLRGLDHRAQNVAYLVPHGNLRHAVAPASTEPLTGDLLVSAVAQLEEALADGAIGMSSGLDYVPSRFADVHELAALCAPLRAGGRVYASHMRDAGRQLAAAFDELVDVGALSQARVHASHVRGPWARIDAALARAAARGVDITYDSYPYQASSSLLGMFVLPAAFQGADIGATLDRLAEPDAAHRLSSLPSFATDHLSRFTLSHIGGPTYRSLEGVPLTEAARLAGMATGQFIVDLLRESRLEVTVVNHSSAASDDDLLSAATDSRHCACSDGIYRGSCPHPRGYAAFTVFLSMYLQRGGGWLQAVEHLATRPARRFGLAGRGEIVVGNFADIAVFDATELAAHATFDRPRQLSSGLRYALVNGELAWSGGAWTGSMSGRVLAG
jgi:N-acyl-D-amino-acid deacylase